MVAEIGGEREDISGDRRGKKKRLERTRKRGG